MKRHDYFRHLLAFALIACTHCSQAQSRGYTPEVESKSTSGADTLVVYPNPCMGSFTICIVSAEIKDVHVVITNMQGEQVKEFNTTTAASARVDASPGVYFVTATTSAGTKREKVVVQ